MSVDKYTKFISEQVRKEQITGLHSGNIQEAADLFEEDFTEIAAAVFDSLAEEIESRNLRALLTSGNFFVGRHDMLREVANPHYVELNPYINPNQPNE